MLISLLEASSQITLYRELVSLPEPSLLQSGNRHLKTLLFMMLVCVRARTHTHIQQCTACPFPWEPNAIALWCFIVWNVYMES